jgi:hypothetical protein
MDNPNPNVPKGQKKNKFKGPVKPAGQMQANPKAACCATPQAQAQQPQQSKPQTA